MKNLSTPKAAPWGSQQIAGMPMMIFLGLATCVLFSGWNGSLPLGMVGALGRRSYPAWGLRSRYCTRGGERGQNAFFLACFSRHVNFLDFLRPLAV